MVLKNKHCSHTGSIQDITALSAPRRSCRSCKEWRSKGGCTVSPRVLVLRHYVFTRGRRGSRLLLAYNPVLKLMSFPLGPVNSLAHGNLSSFISSQLSYHPLYLDLITLFQSQTLSCKSFALSPSLPWLQPGICLGR